MLQVSIYIILTIDVIVCFLLILLTLMQRPKNEGLGATFGGGMTENLFGADTTNVLVKATRILGALLMVLTLLLSILVTKQANSTSSIQARLAAKPAVSATPAPEASAAPSASASATPSATASPAASASPAK